MRSATPLLFVCLAGCGSNGRSPDSGAAPDAALPADEATPVDAAAPVADIAMAADGALPPVDMTVVDFEPPPDLLPPPPPPPPGTLVGVTHLLGGINVLDVSTDRGGGVWAVTPSTVYYFPGGHAPPFTYDQRAGLARGEYTWTDTWFSPGTHPVTFTSVAGGVAAQAIIGNVGAIADRLEVNPATGGVTRIDNMKVTSGNTGPSELPEHMKRVVAVLHVLADVDGTFNGTAYLGGYHGFYAFHGLGADCGCLPFEEHQHYISLTTLGGGDVKALARNADGDIWAGDRDFVQLLPQLSKGPRTGLFDTNFAVGVDVWPDVRDEVTGIDVDSLGGVYVSSARNGLAYLAPFTLTPTFYSKPLPTGPLSGVVVDPAGDVWVASAWSGLVRYRPSTGSFTHYNAAGGLYSNEVNAIYLDRHDPTRSLYLATGDGVVIYRGP